MSLRDLNLLDGYSTGPRDLLSSFYEPCLDEANTYDRAVGYFRSTLFSVAGLAFSEFAERGGRMRLACSPELLREDIDAIAHGLELREKISKRIQSDIQYVLSNPANVPVVEFLSTLVASGILTVRLVFKANKVGIYHNKVGIFTDTKGNSVTFLGTANETLSAWSSERNHEGLEVFCSWVGSDRSRTVRHTDYFETLWEGKRTDLRVIDFVEVAQEVIDRFAVDEGFDAAAMKVRDQLKRSRRKQELGLARDPTFKLLPHQKEAIQNWTDTGYRGLVKHATGAGKTITALEIVRRWNEEYGPALVVVPTSVLVDQWIREARSFLGSSVNILQVGGGRKGTGWADLLPLFTGKGDTSQDRLVVSTMASARTPRFRKLCQSGSHLLLIADEVHAIGSGENRKILSLDAGGRLGLSATPERYGDPEGTMEILNYFGDILLPEVSLQDAIDAGRLVPYDYFVHEIALDEEEQAEWDELTTVIKRRYAQLPEDVSGKKQHTDPFKMLLIRRAAILKQAAGKVDLAVNVVSSRYEDGQRWLVYCDNTEQLEAVRSALQSRSFPVMVYHSAMQGSHAVTLDYFARRHGVLVAIKCLDEGVDIPNADSALILASSSNPREFIQRRGRVLRTAPNKYSATIHDAVVTPASSGRSDESRWPILRTELSRAAQFARGSRNAAASYRIRRIAKAAGLTDGDILCEAYEHEEETLV